MDHNQLVDQTATKFLLKLTKYKFHHGLNKRHTDHLLGVRGLILILAYADISMATEVFATVDDDDLQHVSHLLSGLNKNPPPTQS